MQAVLAGHVKGELIAFGISVNQVSTDLSRCLGMAQENMTYDKSARTYLCGGRLEPIFVKSDADRYLSQFSVSNGVLAQEETGSASVRPSTPRHIDAGNLRTVLEAIQVVYQSLSGPAPRWCSIATHAIAFDKRAALHVPRRLGWIPTPWSGSPRINRSFCEPGGGR